MARSMSYLSVLKKLRVPSAAPQPQVSLPVMHPVPTAHWLLCVYARDCLTRLEETKARVTSIFGTYLKMDSTKKVSSDFSARHVRGS